MRYKIIFTSLCFLNSGHAALADVATIDRQVESEIATGNKHWLETVETQKGQSESTKGIACGWGMNPKQALEKRPDVAAKVANACSRLGVDPALGLAIAYQESRFNQNCVAPMTPHSGGQRAEGVMQVLPSTGKRLFTKNNLGAYNGKNEDHNILAGCLYLKEGQAIAGNSIYHIAGGYHAGYDHDVWRKQQQIPGRWPKTLDYANKISTRWYPEFKNELGGYQGGRYAIDQLKADTYSSGQNGLEIIQENVAISQQRIAELSQTVGTTQTDIASWDRNTQARLLAGQSVNGLNEALALLLHYKNMQLLVELTNRSESSRLVSHRKRPKLPQGQFRRAVYDEIAQKWRVLGINGIWHFLTDDGQWEDITNLQSTSN